MRITLNETDVRLLRDVLTAHLPALRREEAATDLPARELRHELAQRVHLCERLIAELDREVSPSPSPVVVDDP
jgi:hypothetical protein